jgi:hypothetical protein
MFHHLDDPRPPIPSDTLAKRLQAEGGQRRRRRARGASGVALAIVLVAGAVVRPWEADDTRVEIGPSDTASTEPAPTTTRLEEATTSTTEAPPPEATFPANTFAAVTKDGRVVLADRDTGAVVVELDQLDAGGGGFFVARAPDGSAVYAGGFTQGLWRYAPGAQPIRMATASAVSVSPDGTRLAAVAADGPERQGTIWILDSVTGELLDEVSVPDLTGAGDRYAWRTAWDASGDRLFVEANLPEQGGEVYALESSGSLRRLGPPSGRPSGTGWSLGGPGADGEVWILETCCALDANSYDGGTSLLRVDDQRGSVIDRHPLEIDAANSYDVLDAGLGGSGFVLLAPSYEFSEADGGIVVGAPDASMQKKEWPAFAAVDW